MLTLVSVALAAGGRLEAAEVMPPKPAKYFNDEAHLVDDAAAERFNRQLEDFEKETSNQFVVAIYPKMQTDSSLDDYCYRIFHAWGVGQKGKNNGVVLFVFAQDHKTRIQTGYGLEGALPDVTCESILQDQLKPRFKQGDYAGGLKAAIDSIIAATKGEYKGTGQTVESRRVTKQGSQGQVIIYVIFVLVILISSLRRRRGMIYGSNGASFLTGWYLGGGGGGWGGGGGGGDSGGFSGGGGDSGGGGASGDW